MERINTKGQRVCLTDEERGLLKAWQRSAKVSGPQAFRARILELLGSGLRQCDVAQQTGAGIATVGRVRRRFLCEGLDDAVFGYVSTGAPRLLNASEEAHVVALACTEPPAGRSRWTVRLLAEQAVERGLLKRAGRETIRLVLKHHGIKPWREKNVVRTAAQRRVPKPHGGHM